MKEVGLLTQYQFLWTVLGFGFLRVIYETSFSARIRIMCGWGSLLNLGG